ncbi:MAG: OmpW family outer membrane protein [Gammaproteobacteria bacterium]
MYVEATRAILAATTLSVLLISGRANAAEGDWLVRVGGHYVDPKSNNHPVVSVDSSESLTFNATYFYTDHWGIELLAAAPFKHDITLNSNGSKVAETRELPPTLSLQYHFAPNGTIRPYVGLGLNATIFFNEKTRGALAGNKLSLDTSFGPAAQVGVDFALAGDWFVNVDARWIDIDSDAKLGGAGIGTVSIDPLAFGISIGRRFGK